MQQVKIPVDSEVDLPDFVIKIGGAELDLDTRGDILHISVHEEVGRLARARLLVRNWLDDENAVKYTDQDLFQPGKDVEIQLGYNQEFEPVFTGLISSVTGRFEPASLAILDIECRCQGVLMTANRRSRVFAETSDADAASAIVGDYGLGADTESGPSHENLVMFDATDWDFLKARADALGWIFYVRDKTVVFRPPDISADPISTLTWGATLLELEIRQDLGARIGEATTAGWNPDTLEADETQAATGDSAYPAGDGPAVDGALGDASWSDRKSRLPHTTPLAGEELEGRAKSVTDANVLAHMSGQGRVIGLPKLRCDSTIRITDVGDRYSGVHYISAVRHVFGPGEYYSEFQLGRPPMMMPRAGQSDADLIPLARNLVTAVVADIDDPNGWGRVKVEFPWLDGEIDAVWARLMRPDAGKDRGFYYIPEVGDEVIVGFLEQDPRYPVVFGGVWNGTQAPPETLDPETNAIRAIVSRTNHRITMDDSDGAGIITLKSAADQTVVIDDSSGSEKIELSDASGNVVTLDSAGITLSSAADIILEASKGAIKMDAINIKSNSTGPSEFKSSATLDVKASAVLGIEGALVKVN